MSLKTFTELGFNRWFFILAFASLGTLQAAESESTNLLKQTIERHSSSRVCAVLGSLADSKAWNLDLLKEQSCEGCDEGALSAEEELDLLSLRASLQVADSPKSLEQLSEQQQIVAAVLAQQNPKAQLTFYVDNSSRAIQAVQKKYTQTLSGVSVAFETYATGANEDFCVIPLD